MDNHETETTDYHSIREESIRRGIQVLAHASQCRDVNCRRSACTRLKQVHQHVRTCKRRSQINDNCLICKQHNSLLCHHAKLCAKMTQFKAQFCSKI